MFRTLVSLTVLTGWRWLRLGVVDRSRPVRPEAPRHPPRTRRPS